MAVSDVGAVLEFLRNNGFTEAESALKEDVIEKGDTGSFDYEKFFFPMVPPPPPVRVRSFSGCSERQYGRDCSKSSSKSSDDEFVSLGSSTSGACSSEFINPYGIRSSSQTRKDSESSSDRLSQFGTARDYHDFDMQNEPYWYNEKDDDDFMSPSFDGPEFFGCQSEDKFIMTSEMENQHENHLENNYKSEVFQVEGNGDCMDKLCLYNHSDVGNENVTCLQDFCHIDKKEQLEGGLVGEVENPTFVYNCEVPFGKRSAGSGEPCNEDPSNDRCPSLKEIHPNNLHLKFVGDSSSTDSVPEHSMDETSDLCPKSNSNKVYKAPYDLTIEIAETDLPNGLARCKAQDCGEFTEECQDPENAADGEDVTDDELLKYAHEDEYEVFDLRIIHRKNRTGFEESKDLPIMLNTVIGGRYYVTEYLGSAAFSKVVQAHDLQTGIDVCLKIIKNDKDFFDQSLDEIKLLKLVNKNDPADEHHILRLYDYFYHQEHLFIVTELLRANLYEFQKYNQESGGEAYFTLNRLQVITRQCLEALQYLHSLGIIHCDLKPENILIKSYRRCEIKVIDLGSSCFQSDNLCLYVQSRSYRAPEVMLGLQYDEKIDIWSLGCILAELCSGEVLFPNEAVAIILARMIGMLGPIDLEMLVKGQETHKYFTKEYDIYHVNEETNQLEYIIPEDWPLEQHLQVSDMMFIDFVRFLLSTNPRRRPTAKQALKHPWLSYVYDSR
ncbi:dual specificity tyrosine-phosphorylation-regulated kinase 4-like isoform X1 [Neltuma alba]|uniref:dual specificity tyrosine-phosphorylation-regulated kinase 4-like isoform X1 n=1 Tax=Neltuma alba TaxID=207710 RepID=UPI0010A4F3D1|nr:dual specificity tyrosine-phosphorylation-regulated kinase 4-like isoform X1 [Prosopis alba]